MASATALKFPVAPGSLELAKREDGSGIPGISGRISVISKLLGRRDFRDLREFTNFKDIKCSKSRPDSKAFRSGFKDFSDFK